YRNETFTITDANTGAVLDTRSLGNFGNGQWLVWNLSGHVKITVTNNGGMNAVISGLFFGGPPAVTGTSATATYVSTNTSLGGSWSGNFGTDGYSIVNDATVLPSYANLSVSGAQTLTWEPASTADGRDLQTARGALTRIAAADWS